MLRMPAWYCGVFFGMFIMFQVFASNYGRNFRISKDDYNLTSLILFNISVFFAVCTPAEDE